MTTMAVDAWEIAVRTMLVYLGVFVGLRVMGKRELAQMTVFDLVMILLIANAVQNAMVGRDVSVQGGLIAAGVLLVVNRGVAFLRIHSGAWGRLIEGSPTVLVQEGHYLDPALRKGGSGAGAGRDGHARARDRRHRQCETCRARDRWIDQHRPPRDSNDPDSEARSSDPTPLSR
jgi:hypothetical protein